MRAGCQAIVDTAESVHFGRTEALEPFDALTELLTQPIPRNNAFRLGTAVWYAYLAQAVADPQIMEIVTKACRETLDYAAGLLKQAGAPAQEAERLIALSNGLAQATMVGAATANEAVRILSQEVDSLKPRCRRRRRCARPRDGSTGPAWSTGCRRSRRRNPPRQPGAPRAPADATRWEHP